MADFFLRIYDRLKCRKGLAALMVLAIMALCVISMCRLHYEEDIAGFLPIDRSDSRQTEFMEQVSRQNSIAVIFRGGGQNEVSDDDVIAAMDLFEELWFDNDTLGLVPDLSALADESMALELIQFVQEHYASFLKPADYRRMDSLLSLPGYVESQLEADRRSLQMLSGSFTANTIPYDPLNLFGGIMMGLADAGGGGGYRMVDGHIMHRTVQAGLLLFESPFGDSESGRNAQIVELVDKTGAQVTEQTGIKVSAVGAPVIAVTNAYRIKRDSILAVGLAVIGILAVLLYSFRRLDYIMWIAATLLFGALFSLGLIGCIKDSVSIIVIGIGSVIVGIAANYPLHFLHSLRDTADNRESLRQMVVPLLVGNITTVSAFLCLLFLKAQAMHDLALFGSFMLAGTILFTLVFLPLFAKAGGKKVEAVDETVSVSSGNRLYRIVSPVVILITIVMLIWGGSAGFDTDLNHINYMTPQQKEDMELLSGSVGDAGMDRLSILAGMLAPDEEKEAVRQRWTAFWRSHSDAVEQLEREASDAGFTDGAFAPFLESVRSEPDVVSAQDVTPVSMSQVMASLVNSLSQDFNRILFMCGFIVFAFLWISFRRLELALISFLPLTVGWIWILSIMNWCGIQFNIVSIILATFIFGQGDDYTIFITEGLMQEYATGRSTLRERRRSVIISAVIMFIGIGTLIFARHPAMRSLAVITMLGMFVVVVMAHFLPEWLFRWLTEKKGQRREVPVTLWRLAKTIYAFAFLILSVLVVTPIAFVLFLGRKREWKDRWLHGVLYRFSNFVIRRVPGVGFSFDNSVGEIFKEPAVIISNHQSHLDLMCLLMLTPRMVVITNEWVWRNPIYGALIRRAEFVPAAEGVENYMPQLRSLVERGYSILVFPEGTRSEDCRILRFHKGAFHLAGELGLDIVPVCLHGVGHVLPKRELMLRPGHITVTVGKRIPAGDASWGEDSRSRTQAFHRYYIGWYDDLCRKYEDDSYWAPYIRHSYLYKGSEVWRAYRRSVRDNDSASE
ncbi:MAG: 1-acyl-sn-glycerol-3-phosphate acyltransferase [Bacteroidaceae bacterium]|nr:1-acyl-sn-glycerol-3-phosphate acyltransferase [Bacteroidaceae bacterium]